MSKRAVQELFLQADIRLDGERPWDIKIKNDGFYQRILAEGSLALGETYMDGWWECEALDQTLTKMLKVNLSARARDSKRFIWSVIKSKIINQQSKRRARLVGEKHYDVGNDLYKKMLDKRMIYTCGYWRHADNLDDAQVAKLDLICKKLNLKPGMRVLDIGCGWGGLLKFMVEKYEIEGVGITISKEQASLARKECSGLNIEIRVQDYRDVPDKFDRIVSVGMFEHVGYKNYKDFFMSVNNALKKDGLFLLHTMGQNKPAVCADPWVEKYIFPNSILPAATQIIKASNKFRFEDWHSFGPDYDKTLMAWHHNFNKHWDEIREPYGEKFKRMWNYYLLAFAAGFRSRKLLLWQIVFSKQESFTEYKSVR